MRPPQTPRRGWPVGQTDPQAHRMLQMCVLSRWIPFFWQKAVFRIPVMRYGSNFADICKAISIVDSRGQEADWLSMLLNVGLFKTIIAIHQSKQDGAIACSVTATSWATFSGLIHLHVFAINCTPAVRKVSSNHESIFCLLPWHGASCVNECDENEEPSESLEFPHKFARSPLFNCCCCCCCCYFRFCMAEACGPVA